MLKSKGGKILVTQESTIKGGFFQGGAEEKRGKDQCRESPSKEEKKWRHGKNRFCSGTNGSTKS